MHKVTRNAGEQGWLTIKVSCEAVNAMKVSTEAAQISKAAAVATRQQQ